MNSWTRKKTLGFAVLVEGGLFIIACSAGWMLGNPPLQYLHLQLYHIAAGTLSTLPAALAISMITKLNLGPVKEILYLMRQFFRTIMLRTTTPDIILISILAALGEETMFRGLIQPIIAGYAGPVIGILCAATAFGAAHYITPLYALIAAIFGIYLGWLFILTGNLLTPITCHALYDLAAFLYYRKKFSGNNSVIEQESTYFS